MAIEWLQRGKTWEGSLGGGMRAIITQPSQDVALLVVQGFEAAHPVIQVRKLTVDEAQEAAERYARAKGLTACPEAPLASESIAEGFSVLADLSRQLTHGRLSPDAQREVGGLLGSTVRRLAAGMGFDDPFMALDDPQWVSVAVPR